MSNQSRTRLPTVMPFGKYRGVALRALPPEYVRKIARMELREPLKTAIDIEVRMKGQAGKSWQ